MNRPRPHHPLFITPDQAWKEFLKSIPHPIMIDIADDANEILIEI
jgi:hypothetical protein